MVPPYQLLGVPVVPPYHLTKISKLCKTSFYELRVSVLMKEKLFPVSLTPNFNPLKIGQKLVGSCGPVSWILKNITHNKNYIKQLLNEVE